MGVKLTCVKIEESFEIPLNILVHSDSVMSLPILLSSDGKNIFPTFFLSKQKNIAGFSLVESFFIVNV